MIKQELSDFEEMVLEDILEELGLTSIAFREDSRDYLYAVKKFWERRLE